MAHHVHDVTLEPENYTTPWDVTLDTLGHQQNRAMVDRFFIAIQDELDRRAQWQFTQPSKALEE